MSARKKKAAASTIAIHLNDEIHMLLCKEQKRLASQGYAVNLSNIVRKCVRDVLGAK